MHPLNQQIVSLGRRLAWRERALAACWIVSTVLAAALVLGLADYLLRFADPGLRIMATTALVGAATWAAYRWWYSRSRGRSRPLAVARRLEAHFPQLQDSLASALEFLQQSEDDHTAGSAQLRRLVVAEAQNTVEGLPLEEVIDRRPLRRAATWLAAAAIVLTTCLIFDASAVQTALLRLLAPLGSTQWPREHHLAFRNVPKRLAAGQNFEVELVDTAGALPDEVQIHYRVAHDGSRETTSETMTRAGDVMIARRENIRQPFAFRAEGGDDHSMPWTYVDVTEPPHLDSLSITVHPPAYTGLQPAQAERHLEVLAGTGIEVSGTSSQPISGARVLLDGNQSVAATILANAAGQERHAFHIEPEKWIATTSGPYRLELADAEGVAGVVGQWNLRVEPDSPPSVTWQSPTSDLYVTPAAVVPIEVLAKDNLALQRVDLIYERTDKSDSKRGNDSVPPPIELYRGPEKPVAAAGALGGASGDSRVIEYSWELEPLALPVGAQLTLHAEAADYRPGVGRTISPRRLTVVTGEELEARLADRQSQIVRQLERALAAERPTREDVRRLEIQQQDAGVLNDSDRSTIQSAELNQRHVGKMLVDPTEGVPPLIDAILAEIEMNRLTSSDMRETLDRLSAELDRLSSESLSVADKELTAARKLVESAPQDGSPEERKPINLSDAQSQAISESLKTAGNAQNDVIASLERLIAELAGKADYRRFARLLTELRQNQLDHEKTTRADIGLETLPLQVNELTRPQRANLNKAAASQTAIADRFDKIEQGMDQLSREPADDDADGAAGTLADAVELARSLAIGPEMRETAQNLSENRVGQALVRELQIAEKLQQVLGILRNQGKPSPEQLVDKLRDAEKRLAALRQELAALRQQTAQAEKQAAAATNPQQLEALTKRQQEVRQNIDKLARELARMEATDAGETTKGAASRLSNGAGKPNDAGDKKKPVPSNEVQKAEQDLERAAQQLAARRQQAEDDLALLLVQRFQAELAEMVKRQQQVIEKTVAADKQRGASLELPKKQAASVAKLATEEQQLAETAKMHGDLLFGLGAVRVSLEEAQRRLIAAGKLLEDRQTGPAAQKAELHALARLEAMMQTFAQTANEAKPNPNAAPPAGAGAPNNQPQRRPTFELLEVKMLRMLQIDLNERTREYQERLAAEAQPPDAGARVELERESRELAAEQGRLAELVQSMLTRDNEKQ